MKTIIKTYILLLCIYTGIITCNAQNAVPNSPDEEFSTRLNSYIEKVKDELNIKFGIGLSVVKEDQMIYEGYFGYANYEKQLPVTDETTFYIASSTKSFTSLAMLMLEEKGILDLDKSIASYFPEVDFKPELNMDKVNLRDLLYHTSGLENNNITFKTAYSGEYTYKDLTKNFIDYTRVDPRSGYGTFKYSNLGYNVIELILERELGKSWKTVVKEQVLNPLGMSNTSANMSDVEKYNWKSAAPYSVANINGDLKAHKLVKQDHIMHAAGGIISTPRDMAKFLVAQLNNGKLNSSQVFPEDIIHLSQQPQATQERNFFGLKRFAYAYGWNIAKTALGDTLIHHYGGFPGTHAKISFMPKYGVGLSVFANSSMVGLLSTALIEGYIFDYYGGREDVDAYYSNKLIEYKDLMSKRFEESTLDKQKRSERTWDLELPLKEYEGTYFSNSLGTLTLKVDNGKLIAHMGLLKSPPVEPFTKKNSIRLEMIPGSGMVGVFKVENEKVVSINTAGLTFKKQAL